MSVEVAISCPCPGTPHDGDTVVLRDRLGLAAGIEVQRLVVEANQDRADFAKMTGLLAESYLLHGVESWTLVDAAGNGIPVKESTVRAMLLDDFAVSSPVAEKADDLYMAAVLAPLVERAKRSSPSTPTNGSTSAHQAGGKKAQKPSKPSSTTTIPTGSIETTSPSPAGVSN